MVNADEADGFLTQDSTTLRDGSGSDLFVLSWASIRDSGIAPTASSGYAEGPDAEAGREEFERGARLMGLIGRQKTLKPQQLQTVDVLNRYHRFAAVLEPRRSAKTTTLIAWALGRCASREDYLAAYTTCTTGKKARDRFLKDVAPVLERVYPDPKSRPFKIRRAAGQERVEFDNGSVFQVLAPSGDDFRSDAWDLIVLDEAGEATPEMGEDLLAAALPTQDTRPDPLLVVAGTAAEYRDGNLLWDTLEAGRRGDEDTGVIAFNLPDTLAAEDTETWEQVSELLLGVHPGIGTLTTTEALRATFGKMKRELFLREYGGVFGMVGVTSNLFTTEHIEALELDEAVPGPPSRFALGVAVRRNQSRASIVAAWREDDGSARVLLLDRREGVDWLAAEAARLSLKYRTPIVYDDLGPVRVEMEAVSRMNPRPRLEPSPSKATYLAAALLVKEVLAKNLRHWGQEAMVDALGLLRRRKVGAQQFALGSPDIDDDITPAEAASYALAYFDRMPVKRALPDNMAV